MQKVEFSFEKGGVFYAELLEKEAPITCEKFIDMLPSRTEFIHSSCAGQAIICFPENLELCPENQRTVGLYPGTIGLLVKKPEWLIPNELYISYGPYFIPRGLRIDYQEPINIFGQISENLVELAEVGKRLQVCGKELVSMSLI